MTDFKRTKGSKVEFTLEITEEELRKAHNHMVAEYKKHVSVPGFRKGHAPDKEVVTKVGLHIIAREAFNWATEKKYREFLDNNNIRPITPPQVNSPDKPAKEGQPMTLKGSVEVYPEINLKDYNKINVKTENTEATKEDIEKTIEDVLTQFQQAKAVSRAAKEGDFLTIDFRGKDKEGNTLDRTDGKEMKIRVGAGQFLPDLEKAFIGMKAGEEKQDVMVGFPKDYPSDDFAGKKIPFDVKVHEVAEISAKHIDAEMLKMITGKETTLEEFELEIKAMIEGQKKEQAFHKAVEEYQDQLAKIVDVDLPESWMEQEVVALGSRMQQEIGVEPDDKAKKELRKQGEKQLKAFLGLSEIIKKEKIELDKDEVALAEKRAEQRITKQNKKGNKQAELEREYLHMMIDKYLRSRILR